MFDASRRLKRRLSYWALAVMVAAAVLGRPASGVMISAGREDTAAEKGAKARSSPAAPGAAAEPAAGRRAAAPPSAPALTTVADTVYMADGTPAAGAVIITWPAFVTGSGSSIAAGATNVTLGTNGALNVALAPNAGANPAGVYYTVVYQLQPGEVRTEYWMVPTATSPVNLAAVRTTPGSGTAAQPASMQYVNTALAAKADDNSVVHLNGSETISSGKSGAEKKDAAMSFLQNALAMTDAVSSREIVDPEKFKEGISRIIDGTVECLNASTWAKEPTAGSAPTLASK